MTAETTPEPTAGAEQEPPGEPATPFHDLDHYVALRRMTAMSLAPGGDQLVAVVQQLAPDKKTYLSALWRIDPSGEQPARRLTRGASGETSPAFLPDGSLLFVAKRPHAEGNDSGDSTEEKAALWHLPATGGEARAVATRPGGIGGVRVARATGTLVVSAATMPGAKTPDDDAGRRKERKDHAVAAILHEGYPIRYWDHDLGPDEVRLFAAERPLVGDAETDEPVELRDLTPEPGRALDEAGYDVSPDGRAIVTNWGVRLPQGDVRRELVAIDTTTGERRVLGGDPAYEYSEPRISPDGGWVACVRQLRSTTEAPPDKTLWLVPLAGGAGRDLTPDLDLWPTGPQWSPDGGTLYFVADELGLAPVFALDVETGDLRRLAADAAYTDLSPAPDGRSLYALRTSIDAPLAPVRLAVDAEDQTPVMLRGPDEAPVVPGRVSKVTAEAADGTPLHAWLVLPDGASSDTPAPLLLWIHGGPLGSWNAWSWRWSPWLMAARGYAVLLPDPALSTGYGLEFIKRGWGRWGAEPFTDLMSVTDAACTREDIDEHTTAAMGGSFGGYMANWVAGHTDRFKAIVTHASLWALDQFGPTTDLASYWYRELTPERALANSPHLFADRIRTPMLVIHGDRDYRVPIGEALRLWWELSYRHEGEPDDFPHRFLYFPDENHWVLTPPHAKVWYESVLAFLAWHVHEGAWARPDLV
jgi:dipeptidyl aminopeptidase/acylaminoacyl peptidase